MQLSFEGLLSCPFLTTAYGNFIKHGGEASVAGNAGSLDRSSLGKSADEIRFSDKGGHRNHICGFPGNQFLHLIEPAKAPLLTVEALTSLRD
jgi:hypothetical protein